MQELDRGVAEPALRNVYDSLKGEIVGGLVDQPQIGERIADLHPLVKPRAADHAIVKAHRNETIFEFAHLERGAYQNRDFVKRMVVSLQRLDVVADRARLLFRIPGPSHLD